MDKIITLGLIGYGAMGAAHVEKQKQGEHENIRITAIADIDPAKLAKANEAFPQAALFASADELIDSGLCEAVLIATPHYDHPPIAIRALEAGLHVMTEKPAGVYVKQVREMNEAAARSGKIFAIMYNQRSIPAHQKLRELVQGGVYGELKRVTWLVCNWYRTQDYYNSGGWRATWSGEGGGVLINQDPHQLDLWQWICGMPSRIHAFCHEGKWHHIEVEDDVSIYAEYPNGATGVFITTTGEPKGVNRLEITLDRAKLLLEDGVLTLTELEGSTKEHIFAGDCGDVMTHTRLDGTDRVLEFDPNPVGDHSMVLNAFGRAIRTGDPGLLYARGEEGIHGLTISNAAHLSSWLGKTVDLPFDEELHWAELQKKIAASKAKEA